MDVRSVAIGFAASLIVAVAVQYASLPVLVSMVLGGIIGALLPHKEDSQTAALGFLVSAVLMLIPMQGYELPAGLAMFGYTVARHT